jgi:hypothetical protein
MLPFTPKIAPAGTCAKIFTAGANNFIAGRKKISDFLCKYNAKSVFCQRKTLISFIYFLKREIPLAVSPTIAKSSLFRPFL